jgi:hypothetical protein
MNLLRIKSHTPGSHGSSAVAMKPEAKEASRMTTILYFTFYKEKYLKIFGHFSNVYYHTSIRTVN